MDQCIKNQMSIRLEVESYALLDRNFSIFAIKSIFFSTSSLRD